MVNGGDAVGQLFEALGGELAAKLRLADQEDLQEGASLVVDVGEHAKLLQCRDRQPLGLVHNENGSDIAAMGVQQACLQVPEPRRLVGVLLAQAESGATHPQKAVTPARKND